MSPTTRPADPARPVLVHVVEALAGGVLQSVAQLCWAMHRSFDLHVVHGHRAEMPVDFRDRFPPGTCFVAWPAAREITVSGDAVALVRLVGLLRRIHPAIVHAHSTKAGVHARLACVLLGLPCVYSPRGYSFMRLDISPRGRAAFRGIEWLLGRLPGLSIACGRAEFEQATKVARRAALIPNMIDPTLLPVGPTVGRGSPFTVVMSGRIAPQKNFPFFMAVARMLRDRPIAFLWVGGGNDVPGDLPGNVSITGWTSRRDALASVAAASVYLQTALWEGLPLAVLEAMALGLPVVALASPGSAELIDHGRNGYLIHSAEECAGRLAALLNDPMLRQRMGEASAAMFRSTYSSDVVSGAWLECYGTLLDACP